MKNVEKLLTKREKQILPLLLLNYKIIAKKLDLKTSTVCSHFVNILNKLGVNTRAKAIIIAIRQGILDVNEVAIYE